MNKIKVLTDSTSDVIKTDRQAADIDYLLMSFNLDDKEYAADLDWKDISFTDYYGMMRNGKRSVTGQVNPGEFEKKFGEYLKQGYDILYIACSSRLSGSVNTGKMIASELLKNYPEREIVCFDSLRSCYAEGSMAMKAAAMAKEGMGLHEIVGWLEKNKLKFQTYATVGTLDWLRKAGRVKASAAFFGNLFGVKPIIVGDAKGGNFGFKKVKGRKTSLDELVSIVCERIENASEATVYVEHADCLSDCEYVANAIKEKLSPKEVKICPMGPIIGATTGPDTVIVDFFGEEVTISSEE